MTGYEGNLQALDEVEDLLDAYAAGRLSPQGPVLARIRAQVMVEARAASLAMPPALVVGDTAFSERTRWSIGRFSMEALAIRPRRVVSLVGAGMLTIVMSTAVLAAPPGSPFFDARVAIGGAFLPAQVDDRLAAHEQRIADWLFEAEMAAARGDPAALQDALDAYRAEVNAAVADVDANGDRLAHLESMLAKHTAVLTALLEKVPAQANIEQAIDVSQKAIGKIKEKGSNGGGGGGGGGGGRPSQNPGKPDGEGPGRN